ncbi:hypothetical protein I6G82_00525 [Lysinibacillus macroides]|uniref:Uncharacterized protein n=1 Tax=Lysinibacillus macroides TaxID=33935 RepID=A0A0N0CVW8_9BACI|nr:hypothetical protein [Lysinibacillus macroides]KOY82224.1 hypothetical protein ADM90_11335 [Lysinibacillus macroides]QPR68195.1 hypothetical protein I6G82_00525 [Lysinibacillus macroides]
MAEVCVASWLLKIEKEKTQALCATQISVHDEAIYESFCEANQILDADLLHFSNTLGLDLQQPTLLNAFPVEGGQMMYSGYYTVCGEIIEGEMDAWDVVIGEHCFSLIEEGSTLAEPHFHIGFEVVLPASLELIKK